jgi:hypothetical protein
VIGVQDTEKDLLLPAIHGTTNILTAALKVPTIKSIVVTSSFASVVDVAYWKRPGYTYSSTDWNPITYAEAADPNLDLTRWPEQHRPFITYMASEKLAGSAALELYGDKEPQWSLSPPLPTYIGGPYILPLAKGADKLVLVAYGFFCINIHLYPHFIFSITEVPYQTSHTNCVFRKRPVILAESSAKAISRSVELVG